MDYAQIDQKNQMNASTSFTIICTLKNIPLKLKKKPQNGDYLLIVTAPTSELYVVTVDKFGAVVAGTARNTPGGTATV